MDWLVQDSYASTQRSDQLSAFAAAYYALHVHAEVQSRVMHSGLTSVLPVRTLADTSSSGSTSTAVALISGFDGMRCLCTHISAVSSWQ